MPTLKMIDDYIENGGVDCLELTAIMNCPAQKYMFNFVLKNGQKTDQKKDRNSIDFKVVIPQD